MRTVEELVTLAQAQSKVLDRNKHAIFEDVIIEEIESIADCSVICDDDTGAYGHLYVPKNMSGATKRTLFSIVHGMGGTPLGIAPLTLSVLQQSQPFFAMALPGHAEDSQEYRLGTAVDSLSSLGALVRKEITPNRVVSGGHSAGAQVAVLQRYGYTAALEEHLLSTKKFARNLPDLLSNTAFMKTFASLYAQGQHSSKGFQADEVYALALPLSARTFMPILPIMKYLPRFVRNGLIYHGFEKPISKQAGIAPEKPTKNTFKWQALRTKDAQALLHYFSVMPEVGEFLSLFTRLRSRKEKQHRSISDAYAHNRMVPITVVNGDKDIVMGPMGFLPAFFGCGRHKYHEFVQSLSLYAEHHVVPSSGHLLTDKWADAAGHAGTSALFQEQFRAYVKKQSTR